jgi:hypothetical protein
MYFRLLLRKVKGTFVGSFIPVEEKSKRNRKREKAAEDICSAINY